MGPCKVVYQKRPYSESDQAYSDGYLRNGIRQSIELTALEMPEFKKERRRGSF